MKDFSKIEMFFILSSTVTKELKVYKQLLSIPEYKIILYFLFYFFFFFIIIVIYLCIFSLLYTMSWLNVYSGPSLWITFHYFSDQQVSIPFQSIFLISLTNIEYRIHHYLFIFVPPFWSVQFSITLLKSNCIESQHLQL